LRRQGHEMIGIRLDSGDLTWLSVEARKILDEAGFPKAAILASNDLDETIITSLKDQGATIACWGVGTRLVTAFDEPALGGVYKLSALRNPGEPWQYKVKISEQAIKISNPGILQVRRYYQDGHAIGDMIFDEETAHVDGSTMVDPLDMTRRKIIPEDTPGEDLLTPLFRGGEPVYDPPSLETIRSRMREQLACFYDGVKRFVNPHQYPVGLEIGLHERKTQLILKARGFQNTIP
jgi:nicotinate phosphoribosyltransferase